MASRVATASRSKWIDWKAWALFGAHLKPYGGAIAIYIALCVVASLLALATPVLVRHALNGAVPAGDVTMLFLIGAAILGLRVAFIAVNFVSRTLAVSVVQAAVKSYRLMIFRRLLDFERSVHNKSDPSTVQSRIIHDTERADNMAMAMAGQILPAIPTGLLVAGFVLYLDWRLSIIVAALAPLLLVANQYAGRRVKATFQRFQHEFDRFCSATIFFVRHVDLVRMQGADTFELARQEDVAEDLADSQRARFFAQLLHTQTQSLITATAVVVVIVGGGWTVIAHQRSLGDLIAFLAALQVLQGAAVGLLGAVPTLLNGNESLSRMYELVGRASERSYSGTEHVQLRNRIALRDVSFAYDSRPVLNAISFEIPTHGVTAIIGPNGAGKSTLLNIVLGMERPTSGRVDCDGHPYEAIDMTDLRRQIGIVPQNPVLFSGSIRSNIVYGTPGASESDIEHAVELAGITDFIASLPDGLDSAIGDQGVLVSGGQRQRIAIARALVRRPRLLVLDEPTNHLDAHNIQRLFSSILGDVTPPGILLISHDPQAIAHADQVLRLVAGVLEPAPAITQ